MAHMEVSGPQYRPQVVGSCDKDTPTKRARICGKSHTRTLSVHPSHGGTILLINCSEYKEFSWAG